MKGTTQLATIGCWMLLASLALAAEVVSPWQIESLTTDGLLEYDIANGLMIGTKGVIVRHRPATNELTELTAQKVTLNQKTGDVIAEEDVVLRREGFTWRSQRLEYNFKTKVISSVEFRAGRTGHYVSGRELRGTQTNRFYSAKETFLTTDDLENPGHRIRCRTIRVVPGEYVEMEEATLYIGATPVFYWPNYRRSLKRHPNNIELEPGYRSAHGAYLLGTYNWTTDQGTSGSVRLDYRSKRGVALGPEVDYLAGPWGKGAFKSYLLSDDLPGTNHLGRALSNGRARIDWVHRVQLQSNLTALAVLNWQSDAFVERDFFEADYRRNVQPQSFLEVSKRWSDYSLSLFARPQINDYFETVERLPEIRFTGLRHQLGQTPLFYENESSAGYYQRQFADGASSRYSAFRVDTYHQILLPQTYFGWLNVVPRVGGRLTHYGEAHGADASTPARSRAVFNTGVELSAKASALFADAKSTWLEMDGLRHQIEPSVNYVLVPSPNRGPAELPQFDSEIASPRLSPLGFPEYNAIDAVDSQNVLRLMLRNRLQTKRKGEVESLADWAIYTDWRIRPRPGQATFADLFSDFEFKPRSWIAASSELRYDVDNSLLRLAHHRLAFTPVSRWAFSGGHFYYLSQPGTGSSLADNVVYTAVDYRVNEDWSVRATHYFDANEGSLAEQRYTLYHDFRSWTGAFNLRAIKHRSGRQDELQFSFIYSMKAFPRSPPRDFSDSRR
jgi:lipopolysaccharide assembly outer membrane protein LptD (OstA)